MADYNGDLKVVANQLATLTKSIDGFDMKLDVVCDKVSRHDEIIKNNKEEIKNLRSSSNMKDIAVGVAAAVSSAIAAAIGVNR